MNATPINKIDGLVMPDGLNAQGRRAHDIITTYLKAHRRTDTGGGKAFYSPSQWKERGEQYGTESCLIVTYDGGALRPVLNMDEAYALDCVARITGRGKGVPYALYEGMQTKLREAGLYFEECTGWFSAVYSTEQL